MKVLILGSSSFAAQGLPELLATAGHEVWTFNRGQTEAVQSRELAGPVARMVEVCTAAGTIDVLINFMLLKDASVEANLAFCGSVLRLAKERDTTKLIHVSSVSVLPSATRHITEETPAELRPKHKGNYSRCKIATEQWFREHASGLELVVVRPGLIMGTGVVDPMVGIGKLLPGGRLLGLGTGDSVIPFIERGTLHQALERCVRQETSALPTSVLLVAPNSPTRAEYLECCRRDLGIGRSTLLLPRLAWIFLLGFGSVPFSVLKRSPQNLVRRLEHNLGRRHYDVRATERALKLDLRSDWRVSLVQSVDGQERNFEMPHPDAPSQPPGQGLGSACPTILYAGLGRIVRERHLPALSRMGFKGVVEWWDPYVSEPEGKGSLTLTRIENLADATAKHAVVATPSQARASFLGQLPATVESVLFEKPFATHAAEQCAILSACGRQRFLFALHNYRFKPNVTRFFAHLHAQNSGRLEHVRLHFDSPPVANDGAAWLRKERLARTLLCDYAIHFLDLAWCLARGPMDVTRLEVRRNDRGETSLLNTGLRFDNCTCEVFLRQGMHQQRCLLEFVFQNYTCRLSFFPEGFGVLQGRQTFVDDALSAVTAGAAFARKVGEKLRICAPEPSHQLVLQGFVAQGPAMGLGSIAWSALAPFYDRLHALERLVYTAPDAAPSLPARAKTRHTLVASLNERP